jgi:putative hydrolase of the HAD superfamily
MIRAIVFDFGNVVGFFDHRLASSHLAEQTDLSVNEVHGILFGGTLEDDYESGRLTTPEFIARLRNECRLRCFDEEIVKAYSEIFWSNPEVGRLLLELKGRYALLLASNTTELHSLQFRRQFAGVLKAFDNQVLSHEIGVRKPSRAFFEHCERLAGCPSKESVFVDDLEVNVEGARRCGWNGIVYTNASALRRELAGLGVATDSEAARDQIRGKQ